MKDILTTIQLFETLAQDEIEIAIEAKRPKREEVHFVLAAGGKVFRVAYPADGPKIERPGMGRADCNAGIGQSTMNTASIYGLFDATGRCRYVGATAKASLRTKQHSRKGFSFRVLRTCTPESAFRIEGQVIRALKRKGQADLNKNLAGAGRPCRNRVRFTLYVLPATNKWIRKLARKNGVTIGEAIDTITKNNNTP